MNLLLCRARFDAQMRARAIAFNENIEDYTSLSDCENNDEVTEMDTSVTHNRRRTDRRVLHDTDRRPYANQVRGGFYFARNLLVTLGVK